MRIRLRGGWEAALLVLLLSGCSGWKQVQKIALDQLTQDARSAVTCTVIDGITHVPDMTVAPLHRMENGQCVARNPLKHPAETYFSDAACEDAVSFQPARISQFCREIDPVPNAVMGNPEQWPDNASAWTLWPASRLPIGTLSLDGRAQPYMTRREYKTVAVLDDGIPRGTGQCHLDMRIYKRHPGDNDSLPLLAIHGGMWKFRGFGYFGLEAEISAYTEAGFTVFMPVYRLVDDADGNAECNRAHWQDLTTDMQDALAWVQAHSVEYGVRQNEKMRVLGGSAGSQLALWLITHQPEQIERAVLYYSPGDFVDYVRSAREQQITPKGAGALADFLGVNFSTVALDDPALVANSFPQQVVTHPQDFPPVFLLHGNSDALVPSRQSVRLCNAWAGDIDNGPAKDDGGSAGSGIVHKYYACDQRGSQLHLFAQADHMLNVCIPKMKCFAGDKPTQRAIRDVMNRSVLWMQEP